MQEAKDDQDIKEIIPEYESDETQYYYDNGLKQEQEVAQKKFVKNHKKDIRVCFILFLIYLYNMELLILTFYYLCYRIK